MPRITVYSQTITCDRGENLRRVLLKHDISLYNGGSKFSYQLSVISYQLSVLSFQ
jgi:hypothetical protein